MSDYLKSPEALEHRKFLEYRKFLGEFMGEEWDDYVDVIFMTDAGRVDGMLKNEFNSTEVFLKKHLTRDFLFMCLEKLIAEHDYSYQNYGGKDGCDMWIQDNTEDYEWHYGCTTLIESLTRALVDAVKYIQGQSNAE